MAARLEAEPTIIAPVPRASTSIPVREATNDAALPGKPAMRRFAMPGMVVAAAAALTFIATPQLMVAIKAGPATMETATAVASAGGSAPEAAVIAAVGPQKVSATGGKSQPVVLRNQGLDEYLMAHQRFSPSVYSTAQFARSSTFANDSGK
jgi:sigma-E factor negative regulatory protein RseA